ncbi:LLM class flavin-dependent oxidoreductase [Microbulbifer sp. OS29]|uniref:LLM class flavin-dependent oxidoreductase n=1 Tax=Microbulbifer okhotskensis TaxID=2926617 RepID=A0A9X2ESF3_9GAMM|nr:LLM class flavin-dependent oxidoreductase [Microbulbifer okhotskensis]MCO1336575.1 LLM class flavin-dependent oxidoreductase [Microbulbifer okhotskensis]
MGLLNRNIKKSLFWLLDYHPEVEENSSELMRRCIEHTVLSEAMGFDAVWCAEHHFQHLGHIPNPAVLLSALSQVTENIRLGSGVSILPLRHPVQVAEDYAMVDLLSAGRLNMGVGTGGQLLESQGMGCDFGGREERFEQSLDELFLRWGKAAAGTSGVESLNICPVQAPRPPVYIASNNPERIYNIGKAGHGLITIVAPSTESIDDIALRVGQHQRGLLDGGVDSHHAEAVVTVFTQVGENEAEVRESVLVALARILSYLSGTHISDATGIFNAMRDRGTGLFGTEKEVDRMVARYRDAGVQHLAFINRFGGLDWGRALASLKLLGAGSRI